MGARSKTLVLRDSARPRKARASDLAPLESFLRAVEPRAPALAELAEEYLKQLSLSPGSDRDTIVRLHVVAPFGPALDLRTLEPRHVDAWLRSQEAAGYAEATRAKHLSVLGCVLEYARRTGALEADPLRGVDPSLRPSRAPRDPHRTTRELLGPVEVATILRSRAIRPVDRLLWSVLLLTGARIGEALGLCWGDWDEWASPLGRLTIERQLNTRTGELTPTKDGGVRDVPVHPELAAALRAGRALFRPPT